MNESAWRCRVEALKATERHLVERERTCRIREVAISRAIEEGVNPRHERQIYDLVEQCIKEHDTQRERDNQQQFHSQHVNPQASSSSSSPRKARVSQQQQQATTTTTSAVLALDEIAHVAADLDSMRRSILADSEDVALERHRLRIWSEQLHAAFASLNARSVELQLEAERLSGLPQATIQLSSALIGLATSRESSDNLFNNNLNKLTPSFPHQHSSISINNSNKNYNHAPHASSNSQQLHDVLLRREAALNERERHITELFRYVLEQRTLVEKQLELIGQRIEMLLRNSPPSGIDGRQTQPPPRSMSSNRKTNHHPLLRPQNDLLDDLDSAERYADQKGDDDYNGDRDEEEDDLDRTLEGSYPRQ